jgi:hypothetical protein
MHSMKHVVTMLCCLLVVASCTNDPTTAPENDLVTVSKSDLRPDSTKGWLYYSFATDAVIPLDSIGMRDWDIRLPFLTINSRTIDIMLNSGTAGSGSTTGRVIASRWENVTTVDPSWVFSVDDTAAANRVVPNCVMCPQTMFVYSGPPNHAIIPSPDKVLVLRLANGTFVKMQITSIYQGAVAMPTTTTPIGYYTVRYAKNVPLKN